MSGEVIVANEQWLCLNIVVSSYLRYYINERDKIIEAKNNVIITCFLEFCGTFSVHKSF